MSDICIYMLCSLLPTSVLTYLMYNLAGKKKKTTQKDTVGPKGIASQVQINLGKHENPRIWLVFSHAQSTNSEATAQQFLGLQRYCLSHLSLAPPWPGCARARHLRRGLAPEQVVPAAHSCWTLPWDLGTAGTGWVASTSQ